MCSHRYSLQQLKLSTPPSLRELCMLTVEEHLAAFTLDTVLPAIEFARLHAYTTLEAKALSFVRQTYKGLRERHSAEILEYALGEDYRELEREQSALDAKVQRMKMVGAVVDVPGSSDHGPSTITTPGLLTGALIVSSAKREATPVLEPRSSGLRALDTDGLRAWLKDNSVAVAASAKLDELLALAEETQAEIEEEDHA